MNQSQQIAIVTGGASGLGLAIAKKFSEQNIFTVIIGRDTGKLKAVQQQLGEMAATIEFDLNELAAIPALVEKITKQFGRIDILVNNAGINQKKNFTEVTDEEFQNILHTNVNVVFSLSREVVKVMELQGSGSIINISSMAAQYGLPKVIAYTASKSAIEGMTKAMAVELSGKGIRVNAIAPGFIATDMSSKALNGDEERK
jgi:NAD(P)-dependent dehydrogenase (short-subunit alcohol dehydrogenase family)